jgi:hypothetical protein
MRVFVLGPYLAICGLENSVAKQKEMEHMMIAWINNSGTINDVSGLQHLIICPVCIDF